MGRFNIKSAMHVCVMALLVAAVLAPTAVPAETLAEFYKGKRIKIMVRGSTGGNSDMYTRMLARYLAGHMPGSPRAHVINMPGGAGLKMVNYIAKVAPKDGTEMMMVPPFLPMEQALGLNKHLKADMTKLSWIGNMVSANLFLMTRGPSPTKTLEDAKKRQTIMSSTGIDDQGSRMMTIYNNRLGTRFKIIHGYPSGPEMNIAMLRGEVEGRSISNPHLLIRSADPTLGKPPYNLLLQVGLIKDKAYPNVPLLNDIAQNEDDKAVFQFISNTISMARPYAAPANLPPDRVAALREAFKKAMLDPKLQALAKRQGVPIGLMEGKDLEKVVAKIVNSPPSIVKKILAALKPNKQLMAKRKVKLVKVVGKVTAKKRKGRRIKLSNGKTYKISGRFTKKLVVNGKTGRRVRGKIKVGMTCTFMADGKAVVEGDCK